jgi:hypothetical protein
MTNLNQQHYLWTQLLKSFTMRDLKKQKKCYSSFAHAHISAAKQLHSVFSEFGSIIISGWVNNGNLHCGIETWKKK